MAHRAALLRSALCLTTAKPRPSPTLFMFPGLSSKAWHEPYDFDWVHRLEASYDVIRDEYLALHASRQNVLKNNVSSSDYNVNDKEHQLHKGEWDWHSYVTQGRRQTEFATQCPNTVAVLESISGFMTGLPFAYSFFSILKPQSNINAHSAPCNIRLRCHFPIFVPSGCGIRVGDEERQWEAGKAIIFDDAYDHEVWHHGTSGDRVVLLFDVWHPDLIPQEQQALIEMFQSARDKGWLKDHQ